MIKTYFPHITLHDEGTVSLVRELLDAASVGGHRHGSHAAAQAPACLGALPARLVLRRAA